MSGQNREPGFAGGRASGGAGPATGMRIARAVVRRACGGAVAAVLLAAGAAGIAWSGSSDPAAGSASAAIEQERFPAGDLAQGDPVPANPPATSAVEGAATVPSLTIESVPTGAMVTLNGPYQWVGQTPWRLFREVSGIYQVEAHLPGYETWRGEAVLGPGGANRLNLQLSRKTATKAALRSMIVPGWGQFYRGEKTKGTLFLAGGLAAFTGVIWTHQIYQHRLDDFDGAKRDYESASRESDLPGLWARVRRASSRADRAYDDRTLALGLLAGVYAVSLVDALFFTESSMLGVTGAPSASAAPHAGPDPHETGRIQWMASAAPDARVRAGLTYRWQ